MDRFWITVAVPEFVHLMALRYAYWQSARPAMANRTISISPFLSFPSSFKFRLCFANARNSNMIPADVILTAVTHVVSTGYWENSTSLQVPESPQLVAPAVQQRIPSFSLFLSFVSVITPSR